MCTCDFKLISPETSVGQAAVFFEDPQVACLVFYSQNENVYKVVTRDMITGVSFNRIVLDIKTDTASVIQKNEADADTLLFVFTNQNVDYVGVIDNNEVAEIIFRKQFLQSMERRKVEDSLFAYNNRLEKTMALGQLAWWEMNCETGAVIFNEQKTKMLGYSPEGFKQYTDFTNILHPDDHKDTMTAMENHLSGKAEKYIAEYRIKTSSGSYKWFRDIGGVTRRDKDGRPLVVTGVVLDISDAKANEKKVQKSVLEKNVLLKEIHHRVKNNLQIISSLLSLESRSAANETLSTILEECKNRIDSIAMVHKLLYEEEDYSRINLKSFVDMLRNVYLSKNSAIDIDNQCENLSMSIDYAVPCALIINELISNSFKHAFVNRSEGKIVVQFSKKDAHYQLNVSDNGVGLPETLNSGNPTTLGLTLINALAEQINATVQITSKTGTSFQVCFSG